MDHLGCPEQGGQGMLGGGVLEEFGDTLFFQVGGLRGEHFLTQGYHQVIALKWFAMVPVLIGLYQTNQRLGAKYIRNLLETPGRQRSS